jgi:hypothetical protein
VPTATVRVAYRPLRIGFLVRPGEMGDVVRAATWATWVWGGICCPIIPLLDDEDDVDRLISRWNVDVLAPALAPPAGGEADDLQQSGLAQEAVRRHPHLSWPRRVEHLGLFEPIGERHHLAAVDVRLPIDHLWEHEFRHREDSRYVWPSWRVDDPLGVLFLALFGDYGDNAVGLRLRRAYREGLRARELRIMDEVPAELTEAGTPIRLTGSELRRFRGWRDGDGVFVGDPANADDLRQFWNLRATGRDVTFLPEADPARVRAYVAAHLQHMPPREHDFFGEVWLSRTWRRGEQLPEALAGLVPDGMSVLRGHADDQSVARDERERDHFATDSETVLASVEEDTWRTRMIFPLPQRRPFPASRFESHFAHWAISVSPLSEYTYEPRTLRLPGLPDLNPWASREMTALTREVRLQRQSTDFLLSLDENAIDVGLLEQGEVVRRVLERADIEAQPSGAGEVTDRIIRQMGGLQGCRIFRAHGVRDLLSSDDPYAEDAALQKLRAGGGLDEVPRAKTPTLAFDLLLAREALRPVLRLKCPECQIWRLFSPDALATTVQCPGCGAAFLLALHVRKPPAEKQRYSWRFQRSGLLAERGHAGALPVILTMLTLSNTLHSGSVLFLLASHALRGARVNCESDLLVLELDMHGKPAIAIAEVKGRDVTVEERDLSNLEAASERIRESGVDCYLLFATTGAWTDPELTLFREYRDRHLSPEGSALRPAPILFAGRELAHYEIYHETRELLADPHVMSLADLATNSAKLYLDDAPACEA